MFLLFISWARSPWAAHVFFLCNAHDFLFFYIIWSVPFFLLIFFGSHQVPPSQWSLGQARHLTPDLDGVWISPYPGSRSNLEFGILVRKYWVHCESMFFFSPMLKKKMGGFFSRPCSAHVFFYPAHVSAFPIRDSTRNWMSYFS